MSHSPEPWKIEPDAIYPAVVDANGYCILGYTSDEGNFKADDPDYHRIVACVNFCREFSTDQLRGHVLHEDSDDDTGRPIYKILTDDEFKGLSP